MRRYILLISSIFILFLSFSFTQSAEDKPIGVQQTIALFKAGTERYTESLQKFKTSINNLSDDTVTVLNARKDLTECRIQYKYIEFFVEHFFETRIKVFNLPPVHEIEEPYMEYQSPIGMQVMEAYLFEEEPAKNKEALLAELEVLYITAASLPQMLYDKKITDADLLESTRLEIIRIATLGITGYDAPELKTGIREAGAALWSVRECISLYNNNDSVLYYLDKAIIFIKANDDFDSFNRISFITDAITPLQLSLEKMMTVFNSGKSVTVGSLFEKRFLDAGSFSSDTFPTNDALVQLGKDLFFDKRLSGNGKRSCGTCHQPEKYFTDGLPQSLALNEQDHLTRNAPGLLYTVYQHGQFLDARSKSMTGQIRDVLVNPQEMDASFDAIIQMLKNDKKYKTAFKSAFGNTKNKKGLYTIDNLAIAIAAYEHSLPVMTSRFDVYMKGDRSALTIDEQKGFNLFMGKGLCGTCHFAPVFNGVLPPYYNITELESLGMLASADMKTPVPDMDSGRYRVFPIEFYVGTFKTPTVRNIAKTAPYMHNGAFRTLEEVIRFYNEGGGNGLGLDMPYQTLSSKKLQLSEQEIKYIISFMESLTDQPVSGI